jgi:transposase-like protein
MDKNVFELQSKECEFRFNNPKKKIKKMLAVF